MFSKIINIVAAFSLLFLPALMPFGGGVALASGPVPTVNFTHTVSNLYYGEPSEYKASFTLPKGVQVGLITAPIDGRQDLTNAELIVTGLPARNISIDRSDATQRSGMYVSNQNVQYAISPPVILAEDTLVTLTLNNVVNQPFVRGSFDESPRRGPPVGFSDIDVKTSGVNSPESAYLADGGNGIYTDRLVRRPSPRSTPFETDLNFESDNHYFGEMANQVFSFTLPKDMWVGRIGISYQVNPYDPSQVIDLSGARLEVVGLPPGVTNIDPDADKCYTQNFSYALPATILLTEDARVYFKIYNVKNPADPGVGYYMFGISPQFYVSESTYGAGGSTSFFDYNYNYPEIRLFGKWQVELTNRRPIVPETTVAESVPQVEKQANIPVAEPPQTVVVNYAGPASPAESAALDAVSKLQANTVPVAAAALAVNAVMTSAPIVEMPARFQFTRTLKIGMSGADVKELQKYLNANGFTIAKSGAGSPGKENSYFGSLTRKALIKFQKSNKVSPASGLFGPATRKLVNA